MVPPATERTSSNRRADSAVQQLQQGLQPAWHRLLQQQSQNALRNAIALVTGRLPKLVAFAALAVLVFALSGGGRVPFWLPAAVVLAGAVAAVPMLAARDRRRVASLVDAALACDRANDNRDRLTAALELAAGTPVPDRALHEQLAQAAIEDGVSSLDRIDRARIAAATVRVQPQWGRATLALVALLLLPWLLPHGASTRGDDAGKGTSPAVARVPDDGATRTTVAAAERPAAEPVAPGTRPQSDPPRPDPEKRSEPPPPGKPEPTAAVPAAAGGPKSGGDTAGDSSQSGAPKPAPAGNPGAGQPGGGQGSAASGAPEPAPEPPKQAGAKPKVKKPQPTRPQPDQEAKPAESAGAPSGPSRGSGRQSAVGNKRSDLNRGQERDDDPEIEDEPIEDETDEQEQRGGVMPMRRQDQRPAARELSISGDGPPDQGRGGPTPPKKARGTASLVLGLRLPDSVRGQPNPGTAKTSLEQIPPRRADAEFGTAHPASTGRPGTPQSVRPPAPELSPLLAAFHARLRGQDQKNSADSTDPVSANPAAATEPRDRK